jgi:hypothetical protein
MYTHNTLYQLCTLTTSCISYIHSQHPVSVMYTHNTLYHVHSQHPVSVMYTHIILYELCTFTTPCINYVHSQHSVSVMYTHNIHINLIEYFFQPLLKYWIECLVLIMHTQKIRVWFLVHVPFIRMNFFFSICLFVCLFLPFTITSSRTILQYYLQTTTVSFMILLLDAVLCMQLKKWCWQN